MDSIKFVVCPLHNFALPRHRRIARIGSYRIVKLLPDLAESEESFVEAIAEMRSNDRLTPWVSALRDGHRQRTANRPEYVVYYFPPPDVAKRWFSDLQDPDSDWEQARLQLDSLLVAMRLRKTERVFTPPSIVLGVTIPTPEIDSILAGKAPDKNETVPYLDRPPYLQERERVYTLRVRDIAPVQRLCGLVLAGFKTNLAIAMRRFIESQEKKPADRFVDLLVTLEALYGDDDTTSAAHKIAFRAATIVGTSGSQRDALFTFVKKVYGQRSKILHGRSAGTGLDKTSELEDVVRTSLVWFLERTSSTGRVPEAHDIDKMCFESVVV